MLFIIMTFSREIYKLYRKFFHYRPFYNYTDGLESDYPEIYNADGEKLKIFFLADRAFAHSPYGHKRPKYIFWDRYNYGLKTHFYSQLEAFRTTGHPDKRYAMFLESKSVKPEYYAKLIKHKAYFMNEFDYVFTHDYDILNTISNSKFVPFCAAYWYGMHDPSVITADNYMHKDKNISILASYKSKTPLHRLRRDIAMHCRNTGIADAYGTFDGNMNAYVAPEITLQRYRYSIIIENDITPYFFTEKITNCFISQTIPVYLGASGINEFFNPDGIITLTVNSANNIDDVLRQCTPEEYMRRLPAILDNFRRVHEYESPYDYMYAHHLREYYGQ